MTAARAVSRRALVATGLGLLIPAGAGSLTGCQRGGPSLTRVRIAGGETAGTDLRLARVLAAELRRRELVESARVYATSGDEESLAMLADGSVDLAIAAADAVGMAQGGPVAISRTHQSYLHAIVRADSKIRSVADWRQRRVSIGLAGSRQAVANVGVLQALGLSGSVETVSSMPRDGAVSLSAGTVSGLMWWGGLPSAVVGALHAHTPFRLLDLSVEFGPGQAAMPSAYRLVRVPANVYGQSQGVSSLAVSSLLLANASLSSSFVESLVDLVLDTPASLVPQPSDGVQFFAPGSQVDTVPLELHPAAAATYRRRHA